jgi:hypothetical protein
MPNYFMNINVPQFQGVCVFIGFALLLKIKMQMLGINKPLLDVYNSFSSTFLNNGSQINPVVTLRQAQTMMVYTYEDYVLLARLPFQFTLKVRRAAVWAQHTLLTVFASPADKHQLSCDLLHEDRIRPGIIHQRRECGFAAFV